MAYEVLEGLRPLQIERDSLVKMICLGFKGPRGSGWGLGQNIKNKDSVVLIFVKFSKSIDLKKKHIYRIWSWKILGIN